MAALGRKDKQALLEVDAHVKEIRQQFSDQVKCFDNRTEMKTALISDVQEFFKKRAEVEIEYSQKLDKLSERYQHRLGSQRGTYGLTRIERASTVNVWNKLIQDTRYKAKTASSLSDIFVKNVAVRLGDLIEDIQRISKSVRDTHLTLQEEVMKMIYKLQQSMKTYYTRQSEFVFAESKLRTSEMEKKKAEESPNKRGNEKKIRNIDKIKEKREQRYNECKMKATKARNEYILVLEAAKAVISKYYDHDLSEIISQFDHNYHNSFSCALQAYSGAESRMANSFIGAANSLMKVVSAIDPDTDRLMFLEDNQGVFVPESKIIFQSHGEDKVKQITAVNGLKKELGIDHEKLFDSLKLLESELQEVNEVIEKRTNSLNEVYKQYDSELNAYHHIDLLQLPASSLSNPPSGIGQSLKANKEELENYLLAKFKECILSQNLNTQKQAKYEILSKALGEISAGLPSRQTLGNPNSIGSKNVLSHGYLYLNYLSSLMDGNKLTGSSSSLSGSQKGRPIKLFGTSLDEQLKGSDRDIPEIVESCIKFITKFGLNHQGIFRVSGTSQEIADMKKSFEEGRDPLAGLNHWKDINAVAGVFRAYFRELKEPLFPSQYSQDYIRISRLFCPEEQIQECKKVFEKIPTRNMNIIKYLIKFLQAISTKSERNLMDAHNLAVVFGPTLIRVPDNEDPITVQGQVNVFMKFIISEYYALVPDDEEQHTPENHVISADETDEKDDDTVEHTDDELGSEEEADAEFMEAEALYGYTARTHKELSFRKGDVILVFSRTNADWWDAQLNGQNGFVPATYVKLLSPEHERFDSIGSSSGIVTRPNLKEEIAFEPQLKSEGKSSSDEGKGTTKPAFERTISVESSSELQQANVFASIDPTSDNRKPVSRESSFKKTYTLPQRGGPGQLNAAGPQPFRLSQHLPKTESQDSFASDSLSSTLTAVREAFSGPRGQRVAAVKPMQISNKELMETQSKLRPGTPEDMPQKRESPEMQRPNLSPRGSVKDMTKLFGVPRKSLKGDEFDSPTGSTTRRSSSGSTDLDNHSRSSSVSSEKDASGRPAPAVLPKPKRRDGPGQGGSSELIATIHAAAVAKVVKETKEEGGT